MNIVAESKNVRVSPRKMRMIADAVKALTLSQALVKLQFMAKSGAQPMFKTVKSAVANATNNAKLKMEDLKIENILVDEGFKMKRRDTSHGARYGGGLIQKKTCHIKVILNDGK